MKDFDAIKDLWQQSKPAEQKAVDMQAITRQSKDTRTKLFRQLLFGGITLFLTVVFITWMMYFSTMKLTWFVTHIAIWIINTTVLLQSALTLFTAYKVSLVDDT